MTEKYGLSEKYIAEEYEDLLFRKVMAKYAEKESAKIEAEIEEKNFSSPPLGFSGIIRKTKNKKAKKAFVYGIKTISLFLAAVIAVSFVSIASVVVVPAGMQEDIRSFLGTIFYRITDESVDIKSESLAEYIDPEFYTIENALVPTYLPEGYIFSKNISVERMVKIDYVSGEKELAILEYPFSESRDYSLDYDENDRVEEIVINGNEAIVIDKAEGTENMIFLRSGAVDVLIYADEPVEEIIKIAEGLFPAK